MQRSGVVTEVHHHRVCRHQVEVEAWPARVELNFADERAVNPINTEARFEAIVYNSGAGASWEVRDLDGNPGQGTIDASGLYRAPPKGALPSGFTEIVVVTAREDPLRKAYAWVTLVGLGPAPLPLATVDIAPKQCNMYFTDGFNNAFIDDCNKFKLFRATARDSANMDIEWLVDSAPQPGTSPWFLYRSLGGGFPKVVTLRARLKNQTEIFDDAEILIVNYIWPGA